MSHIMAAIEVPRKGKTTIITGFTKRCLLNKDWMLAHYNPYWNRETNQKEPYFFEPKDIVANYYLKIKGATLYTNDEMKRYLFDEIKIQTQKKIILIDECAQLFPALDYQNKIQMAIVRSFQQYPKLRKFLLYCSAPGASNGVDPNLRKITQFEFSNMVYHHHRNRRLDTIEYHLRDNYEDWDDDGEYLTPAEDQSLFDTWRPVK